MRFNRALGHVQIASDFRVVTPLEQQINDLPLPGPHLYEIFFHKNKHLADTPQTPQLALKPALGRSGFGSLALILHSRGQTALQKLTNCENSVCAFFCRENRAYDSHRRQIPRSEAEQFCSPSKVNHLVQFPMCLPANEHDLHRSASADTPRPPTIMSCGLQAGKQLQAPR